MIAAIKERWECDKFYSNNCNIDNLFSTVIEFKDSKFTNT